MNEPTIGIFTESYVGALFDPLIGLVINLSFSPSIDHQYHSLYYDIMTLNQVIALQFSI